MMLAWGVVIGVGFAILINAGLAARLLVDHWRHRPNNTGVCRSEECEACVNMRKMGFHSYPGARR